VSVDTELSRLVEARMANDHNFQMASLFYLIAIIGVVITGATFLTARIYAMRSDRELRDRTGVYAPDWQPPPPGTGDAP
jgi:uncharacterized membrane protein YciS (DUF1049 family)